MIMVREVLQCKPGQVSALVKKFKDVGEVMSTMDLVPHRIYTDVAGGKFWTLVLERDYESLDEMQAVEAQAFGDERSKAIMSGYHEFIQQGTREIYKVQS